MVALALASCSAEAPPPAADDGAAPDCSVADPSDACVHVVAPLGPGPFTGCTCGDVLRISPVNPDLAECVTP